MQFQTSLVLTASAASIAASAASAAIYATDNFGVFSSAVVSAGEQVASVNFAGIGAKSIGPTLSGVAGGVTWTASALNGSVAQDLWGFPGQDWLSTEFAGDESVLRFELGEGVRAVGGEFFAVDVDFNIATDSSFFRVELADGKAFEGVTGAAPGFTGFISDSADIVAISISVSSLTGPNDYYPAASGLYFSVVPAPGAIALLGALGLVGNRSRRR
jgi:hypothetical protein